MPYDVQVPTGNPAGPKMIRTRTKESTMEAALAVGLEKAGSIYRAEDFEIGRHLSAVRGVTTFFLKNDRRIEAYLSHLSPMDWPGGYDAWVHKCKS